jgi:hypothetical protein
MIYYEMVKLGFMGLCWRGMGKFTCYFSRRERQDAEIAEEGVRFGNHAHNSTSLRLCVSKMGKNL